MPPLLLEPLELLLELDELLLELLLELLELELLLELEPELELLPLLELELLPEELPDDTLMLPPLYVNSSCCEGAAVTTLECPMKFAAATNSSNAASAAVPLKCFTACSRIP